jgi:hypothetical protein
LSIVGLSCLVDCERDLHGGAELNNLAVAHTSVHALDFDACDSADAFSSFCHGLFDSRVKGILRDSDQLNDLDGAFFNVCGHDSSFAGLADGIEDAERRRWISLGNVTTELSFTARPGLNRRRGGVLALVYPIILIDLALSVEFRATPRGSDFATAVLGGIVLLIAAPTTWVFAIDFIEASRLTVISAGALSSLPLWYLLGSRLAVGADEWRGWLARYASVCGLWTTLTLVLIVVLDAVA